MSTLDRCRTPSIAPPRFAALRRFRLGDFPLLPVADPRHIAFVAIFAEFAGAAQSRGRDA